MEEKVLAYIKEYMENCGVTPTIREIAMGVGLKSTSSVYRYFERLVLRGAIEQLDGHARYRVKGMKYIRTKELSRDVLR